MARALHEKMDSYRYRTALSEHQFCPGRATLLLTTPPEQHASNILAVTRSAVAEVLGCQHFKLDTPLDTLDATSLDRLEIAMALEERLGVELSDELVSGESSVRLLALRLEAYLLALSENHDDYADPGGVKQDAQQD